MGSRQKCEYCGYLFQKEDGSVCPQCFTSLSDEQQVRIIDSRYSQPKTIPERPKKNIAKPYVSPSYEKDKNSLIALVVLTGIATLIGLLFAIFNGL